MRRLCSINQLYEGAISSSRRISRVMISRPSTLANDWTASRSKSVSVNPTLAMTARRRRSRTVSRRSSSRFPAVLGSSTEKAGHVPARSGKAVNQAGTNCICRDRKDDWRRGRRLLCSENGWGAARDDNVHLELGQLGRDFGYAVGATIGPPRFDHNGAAFGPAKFAQPLGKGGKPTAPGRSCGRTEKPDSW
jgi:hypothetical protein